MQRIVLAREAHATKSAYERNRYGQMARIRRTEERQRRGSQYARDHKGEPGRNGGSKGI